MIVPHTILSKDISSSEIDLIAEREGYIHFLPYTFIRYLAYSFSFHMVGKSPYECIQEINPYTQMFGKLIGMIHYDEVSTFNPITFAIRTLKLIHRRVNLRKLEEASKTKMEFTFEITDKFQNYKCDLSSLSDCQLETIGVQRELIESLELSDEVLNILRFYDGLKILKNPVDTTYDIVKQQIRSYNDFFKVRKYKFALPTFNVDLGMKKLQITKIDDSDIYTSEVIVAIDCSSFMTNNPNSRSLIRSVLLHYIGQLEKISNLTVTLVYTIGRVSSIKRITNPKELSEIFVSFPNFVLPVYPLTTIFSEFNKLYAGRSVILISDGSMVLKEAVKLKCQLYSIVLTHNDILKQMSLLSGGQFIVLK
jgi:hypothetical protein